VYLTGDIPQNGYFTLYVPTSVGMPTGGITDITLKCNQYCDESTITLSYTSSLRLITFSGVVPSASSYITAPGPIEFTLKGFTNPASSASAYF
jgi:hypothetical protein